MPFGIKPLCIKCSTDICELWRKTSEGKTICNDCFSDGDRASESSVRQTEKVVPVIMEPANDVPNECADQEDLVVDSEPGDGFKQGPGTRSGCSNVRTGKSLRKPTRGRSKKTVNGGKMQVSKGRGRRTIFKKQPLKAPSSVSTCVTSGCLFYKGIYYQVGDIVSLMDDESGIYYAQIRGLLQDQYCEKSAVLTWLIPTQSSPPPEQCFDPNTYILGPEEELPRKLEYLEFVMHAPNEYYKLDMNIRTSTEKEAGYVWTSMGPVRRTIHT